MILHYELLEYQMAKGWVSRFDTLEKLAKVGAGMCWGVGQVSDCKGGCGRQIGKSRTCVEESGP